MGRLREVYDCVIVGAGPAGLSAAQTLAHRVPQVSLLIVDKSIPWERPKPCAEAVGRLGLEDVVQPDHRWIRHEVSNAAFHGPSGGRVTYTDANKGYIIDRAAMQGALARRCVEAGADCFPETGVSRITPRSGGYREVRLDNGGLVRARVVIDASGPLSLLGKSEGIQWKPYDLEPAYYVIAEGVEHEEDTVHLYVGSRLAPGGYGWCFPSADTRVNIGLLIGSPWRGRVNIRRLLEDFLRARFPGARVISSHGGAIPCGYRRSRLAVPGLLRAGDAACTVNPVSRAGIVEAMKSGRLAAEAALAMLGAVNERSMERICAHYERSWYRTLGRRHEKLLAVKGVMQRVPDKDYDRAAVELARIAPHELTLGRIFMVALGRFPRLLWAMRHML